MITKGAGSGFRFKRQQWRVAVTAHGVDFFIRLAEARRQRPHKPTAEERAAFKRSSFNEIPMFDYRPTGLFTLAIREATAYGIARSWTDGRRATVERQMEAVLLGFHELAEVLKQRRVESEAGRVEEAKRARLAAEEQERQRKELGCRSDLLKQAEDWEMSQLLRRYVQATVERLQELRGPEPLPSVDAWAAHALLHAKQLDPLSQLT